MSRDPGSLPAVVHSAGPAETSAIPVSRQQRRTLDRAAVAQYAAATTDDNPIHLDDDAARSVGLSGAVAHGMLGVAIALETARTAPDEAISLRAVRFVGPVPVGAEIAVDLHAGGEDWQFRVEVSGQLAAEGVLFRADDGEERC